MSTSYYVTDGDDSAPGTLLRRADYVDEVFAGGKWQPTKDIVDYMFGHNNNVTSVSEAVAREIAPQAFNHVGGTDGSHRVA